jgi:hypothetical protein
MGKCMMKGTIAPFAIVKCGNYDGFPRAYSHPDFPHAEENGRLSAG